MKKFDSNRALQILSALFGLTGTMIMVWGTLISSPVDIASLGGLYFGINPNYLQSIAESKASTTVGFFYFQFRF